MSRVNNDAIITYNDVNLILGNGTTTKTGAMPQRTYNYTIQSGSPHYNLTAATVTAISNVSLNNTMDCNLTIKTVGNWRLSNTDIHYGDYTYHNWYSYHYFEIYINNVKQEFEDYIDLQITTPDYWPTQYEEYHTGTQEQTITISLPLSGVGSSTANYNIKINERIYCYNSNYVYTYNSLKIYYTGNTSVTAVTNTQSITGNTRCATYGKIKSSSLPASSYILYNSGSTSYDKRLVKYYDFYKAQTLQRITTSMAFGYASGSTNSSAIQITFTGSRALPTFTLPSWLNFSSSGRSNNTCNYYFITNSQNGGSSARTGTITFSSREAKTSASVSVTQNYKVNNINITEITDLSGGNISINNSSHLIRFVGYYDYFYVNIHLTQSDTTAYWPAELLFGLGNCRIYRSFNSRIQFLLSVDRCEIH